MSKASWEKRQREMEKRMEEAGRVHERNEKLERNVEEYERLLEESIADWFTNQFDPDYEEQDYRECIDCWIYRF